MTSSLVLSQCISGMQRISLTLSVKLNIKKDRQIGLHLSVVTYFDLKLCILVLRDSDFTRSKIKSQISLEIISIFKSFA